MKFNCITIIFLLLSMIGQSQNTTDLYLYREQNKLGLINRNGEIILEPNYSHIGQFSEGKAAVTITTRAKNNYHKILGTKMGYIDTQGELIIPLKFEHIPDEIKDFSEGLAVVKIDNKYGYINADGRIVIPIQFSRAYPFNEGYAVVELKGNYRNKALIDKTGNVVYRFLPKYQSQVDSLATHVLVSTNKISDGKIAVHTYLEGGKTKSAVFDSKGELIFHKRLARIKPFTEGLAVAIVDDCKVTSANCFTIIDDKGDIKIDSLYYPLIKLNNKRFLAKNRHTGHQKIIDENGDILQPLIEKGAEIRVKDLLNSSELLRVYKNGKATYMDQTGKKLSDYQYANLSPFSEGLAFGKLLDRTVVCMDKNGDILFEIDPKYDASWSSSLQYEPFPLGIFKNGLATINTMIDGVYRLVHVDKNGNFLEVKEE